ncbi:MAG: hypothetical protein KKA30_09745 [Alphaproteobacteria bacterium]|nr:hypothetical protein [Alphaproteobacteria bacterium]MBU2307580.1 hypothetical protein [Alphaproteobacteria bacterium]
MSVIREPTSGCGGDATMDRWHTSLASAGRDDDPDKGLDVDREVLDDGQEEVFSYTAVASGQVADPKALGPEDLARAPKSPGPIRTS